MIKLKSAIFIQARLKSTRLEKKVLIEYKGLSIIEYLINRIKSNLNLPIVLLTSINSMDDELELCAKKNKIYLYRGSEDDVIDRFTNCAKYYATDKFYLVFGDEPFIDTSLVKDTFSYLDNQYSMIVFNNNFVEGTYGYGFTLSASNRLNFIKTNSNNEVWGEMAKKSDIPIHYMKKTKNDINVRLTIDYIEDFEVFKKIIDHFGNEIFTTKSEEIIKYYIESGFIKINGKRITEYYNRIVKQGNI